MERGIVKQQFDKIKKAIPKEWIDGIGNKDEGRGKVEVFLKETENKMSIQSCSLKLFYNFFRMMIFVKPIANGFWSRLFPGTENENIWENLRINFMDPMIENFNFLLRHNAIYTKMRLCKIVKRKMKGFYICFYLCLSLQDFMGEKIKPNDWNKIFLLG